MLLVCTLLVFMASRLGGASPTQEADSAPIHRHTEVVVTQGTWSRSMRRLFVSSSSPHQTKHSLIHLRGGPGSPAGSSRSDDDDLDGYGWGTGQAEDLEVWARGLVPEGQKGPGAVRAQLPKAVQANLTRLCGRCLYRTLTNYTHVAGQQGTVFVMTGDIPAMWTRDSAVQAGSYIPRIPKHPFLKGIVEGALRALAYFTLQDPYANAFRPAWEPVDKMTKADRQLGRGGWVWTRNFELDSIGYFFNFINNYYRSPGVWGAAVLLHEPVMHDAVLTLLRVLETEQDHERRSPYRYSELVREGLGRQSAVTGMVWSAFRPSDDVSTYAYSIPANMYVAGSLERIADINLHVWRDPLIANLTMRLASEMRAGIERWGVVPVPDQPKDRPDSLMMYAYEIDGLGKALTDFDDPNLPSLLAIPLLGYQHYDEQTYLNTRARVMSDINRYYYVGDQFKGLGSPHTPMRYVWPLAHIVQALTSTDPLEQAALLQDLDRMSQADGLVHESVNVDGTQQFTRPEFGWASAMTVVAVEQLLGVDCDEAAEELRLQDITSREVQSDSKALNGGPDRAWYYEQLSAQVNHRTTDQQEQQKPQSLVDVPPPSVVQHGARWVDLVLPPPTL